MTVSERSVDPEGPRSVTAIRVSDPVEEPFYSVASLAKKLALSERTIRDVLKRGELPCYRIGAQLRVDPADLKRWLEARRERR